MQDEEKLDKILEKFYVRFNKCIEVKELTFRTPIWVSARQDSPS